MFLYKLLVYRGFTFIVTHARHSGFQQSVHPRDYYLNMKNLWQKVLATTIQSFVCCLHSETCEEKLNHHTTWTQNLQRVERSLRHQILVARGRFQPPQPPSISNSTWCLSLVVLPSHYARPNHKVLLYLFKENAFTTCTIISRQEHTTSSMKMNTHNAPEVCIRYE
jgi:hypothetical protein